MTLQTHDHASFQTAWEHFAGSAVRPCRCAVSIAIAGPVTGEVIHFTNNPWIIRPAQIAEKLGVDRYTLVNDFAAVAHAAARAAPSEFVHLAGPDVPLPGEGVISVIGPGTGLGVGWFLRDGGGGYHAQATEGGHFAFAPLDTIEEAILARLHQRHSRVSVERVVAGPGIVDIYEALAGIEGKALSSRLTTAPSGSAAPAARTALPPPRSTVFASRSARSPATSRWSRGRGRWSIAGGLGLPHPRPVAANLVLPAASSPKGGSRR